MPENIIKILMEAGWTKESIAILNEKQVESALALHGYDEKGEKLPQPDMFIGKIETIEEEEYTVSGSAENTLNLGNYSSAKRGVFVSKKFKMAKNTPDAERYAILRGEVKKVQLIAETQLSGICMEAMGPSGFDDASWLTVTTRVFKNVMAKTKAAFGIKDEPKAPAAT